MRARGRSVTRSPYDNAMIARRHAPLRPPVSEEINCIVLAELMEKKSLVMRSIVRPAEKSHPRILCLSIRCWRPATAAHIIRPAATVDTFFTLTGRAPHSTLPNRQKVTREEKTTTGFPRKSTRGARKTGTCESEQLSGSRNSNGKQTGTTRGGEVLLYREQDGESNRAQTIIPSLKIQRDTMMAPSTFSRRSWLARSGG